MYAQKQWTYKPQDRVFIVLLFCYKDINRVETTSLYDTTYRWCSLSGKQLLPPQYQMTPTSETISGASYRLYLSRVYPVANQLVSHDL